VTVGDSAFACSTVDVSPQRTVYVSTPSGVATSHWNIASRVALARLYAAAMPSNAWSSEAL
jgi:hypothetical protein